MNEPDYYHILGLPPGSSIDDVKRQYRRLAKLYHPDRNPGEEQWCTEQLRKVNDAFRFLSDEVQKVRYDQTLRQHGAGGPSAKVSDTPDWATTGDGRSTYTRWRPKGVDDEQPEPPTVVEPPTVHPPAKKREVTKAVLIGVLIATAVGIAAYDPTPPQESLPPAYVPKQHHAVSKPAVAVRLHKSAPALPRRQTVVMPHTRPAAATKPARSTAKPWSHLSAAEKDRQAEHLADAVERAKHSSAR